MKKLTLIVLISGIVGFPSCAKYEYMCTQEGENIYFIFEDRVTYCDEDNNCSTLTYEEITSSSIKHDKYMMKDLIEFSGYNCM